MRSYYADGAVTIWHGDCREIDAWDVAGGVLVTDPPYGLSFVSNRHGPRWETAATADRPVSIAGDHDASLRDDVLARWLLGEWLTALFDPDDVPQSVAELLDLVHDALPSDAPRVVERYVSRQRLAMVGEGT